MTVGIFVAFFVQRPSAALERNAIFMPWVSIVLTTFWTRLLYLDDPATLDAQLGQAAKEASEELSAIALRYATIDQQELSVAKEAARTRPRPAGPDPAAFAASFWKKRNEDPRVALYANGGGTYKPARRRANACPEPKAGRTRLLPPCIPRLKTLWTMWIA